MPARLLIKKYTGKDGDFGTPVSSIGLKRVDTCVPSVYSSAALEGTGHTVPADDASEANTYCVYRPDNPDCYAYSMESVFKIHLVKAPDVQLSNIRLYPVGDRPTSPTAAKLYIGNSISYSRPTNQKSQIALNDIWDYSREHPFYLTVAGLFGQMPDSRLSKYDYKVEYKDCGYGNLIYLDGDRQPSITAATRTNDDDRVVLTFHNESFTKGRGQRFIDFVYQPNPAAFDSRFIPIDEEIDETTGQLKYPGYVNYSEDFDTVELVVLDKARGLDLIRDFPRGLIYKMPVIRNEAGNIVNVNAFTGAAIQTVYLYNGKPGQYGPNNPAYTPYEWHETTMDPNTGIVSSAVANAPYGDEGKPVIEYDVYVDVDDFGHTGYVINGVRRPMLSFDINHLYVFRNRSGALYPLRFIGNSFSPIANVIEDVVVDGVIVENGATNSELITVDPEKVLKSGRTINAYQCVVVPDLGSFVYNQPLFMCGNYNLCRVDGGIYNPMRAGETDYVYLQLEVSGRADPGYCVPDIEIEYDEN